MLIVTDSLFTPHADRLSLQGAMNQHPTPNKKKGRKVKMTGRKLTVVDLQPSCKKYLDIHPLHEEEETDRKPKPGDVVRLMLALPRWVVKVYHVALWWW
jgi:hypothetical protein